MNIKSKRGKLTVSPKGINGIWNGMPISRIRGHGQYVLFISFNSNAELKLLEQLLEPAINEFLGSEDLKKFKESVKNIEHELWMYSDYLSLYPE